MAQTVSVIVGTQDRARLTAILGDRNHPLKHVQRANIVLLSAARLPVLEVSRRKSGNYTVRRPLEIGAAMAGGGPRVLAMLAAYGEAIGEAFQLRDDLLGIFGSPTITGKPAGGDLFEHKATSVVVAAYQLADTALRRQLTELMSKMEGNDALEQLLNDVISNTDKAQALAEQFKAQNPEAK